MALSAFDDKSRTPSDSELAEVLGDTFALWSELKARIASRFAPLTEEWTFAGKKYGWSLRLRHRKRAVLYMTPCPDYFRVSFALGEKATEAAHRSSLPEAVLETIDNATRYPEGRAVRIEARTRRDIEIAEQIAAIKMAS